MSAPLCARLGSPEHSTHGDSIRRRLARYCWAPVTVITASNATAWQPGPAEWERSSTPGIDNTAVVVAAGIGMETVVGALASMEMLELAQDAVFVEVAAPHATEVIVTANELGFVISKYTALAGPPGYSDALTPVGVSGITVSDWAIVPAPDPVPEPVTDQVANAMPPPTRTAATIDVTAMNPLLILITFSFECGGLI